MRIAKRTSIILGSLVLLLVAAAFVLTSVVDPNRYRGKIEHIVGDLAGRPFVIEGNLEITWYPWLGLRTGAAHLSDLPAIGGAPLVEWQSIAVAAKVLPLLRGEIVADRIRLQGVRIHLRRNAQGHGNWEDLGARKAALSGPATLGPVTSTSSGASASSADEAGAVAPAPFAGAASAGAAVSAGAAGSARPVALAGSATPARPVVSAGSATPAGSVVPPGSATSARSVVPAGAAAAARPVVPPDSAAPAGSAAAAQRRPLQIAGIEIRDGVVDYVDEKSGLRANVSSWELDVGEWVTGRPLPVHTRFLVQTQSLPPDGVWVQVDAAELAIRAEPLAVGAPKLSVRVADAQMDGDLTYEQTADAHVRAHGALALHAPSLRKLANDLALNQTMPHDPTTLGPLELTTRWSYADGSIAAKPLAVKLDGVNFNGWLERTAAPPAMWGFELHGDRIDLGRYVNVDSTNKKPFELPVDALRAINANGSVIFDQVVLADTHMANVRLRLQTSEGRP